jgi:spore maturation protein CgeB
VGTYSAYKERILNAVRDAFPEVHFRIYGNGWNQISRETLKPCVADRPVYGLNYAQLANAAKINLAMHMGRADETGWEDQVSTRSFELPACKGFMLHVDSSEVRQLYDVGREIDVFSSADDLCERIRFYLKNDTIRMQMVERAYRRCVPAYSYDCRARDIASFIECG